METFCDIFPRNIFRKEAMKYLKNIKETGIATGIEKVTVLAELPSETLCPYREISWKNARREHLNEMRTGVVGNL